MRQALCLHQPRRAAIQYTRMIRRTFRRSTTMSSSFQVSSMSPAGLPLVSILRRRTEIRCKCQDMTIRVEAVGSQMSPITFRKIAHILRAAIERPAMIFRWIIHDQVYLCTQQTCRCGGIGDVVREQAEDSRLGHQPQNRIRRKFKLRHSWSIQTRFLVQNHRIKFSTLGLVVHIQNRVTFQYHIRAL